MEDDRDVILNELEDRLKRDKHLVLSYEHGSRLISWMRSILTVIRAQEDLLKKHREVLEDLKNPKEGK